MNMDSCKREKEKLFWRTDNELVHTIDSLRLINVLDFCLLGLKIKINISDIDILLCILASIEIYGNYDEENSKDVQTINGMIEEIQRSGEIELFKYEK